MSKFTYPFAYTPSERVRRAASDLIAMIDVDCQLRDIFRKGKMMGVLITSGGPLYAFSGLAGGRSCVDRFVPPIFDCCSVPELSEHLDAGIGAVKSARLQDWLFEHYIVHNALGESLSIKEIFALRGLIPPGGTGECCAPKLLEYAYKQGITPLEMGEFWYGDSPECGEIRSHGCFYPSCSGKCGPLLSWMLKGLELEDNPLQIKFSQDSIKVIHEDEDIIVVSKPSGMLCAPGLTGELSLPEFLSDKYGTLFVCHRLDMDTAGIMVYARSLSAQINLQAQFAARSVQKTYLAHLCAGRRSWKGPRSGTIALPLSSDYYDRPRQIVDREKGKQAITKFQILNIFPDGEMDVRLTPLTGRTHQLRVHCASESGLGRPIKGDRLYGDPNSYNLQLLAESISFTHPVSGEVMSFRIS